ncbi:MAG: 4-hydroxy-tetrahydrodipicolinate synthase [Chitinophagaceae bacterium]
MIKELLRGTGVALVTPFSESGAVDETALQNLINFVIDNGVQYLVSLGTTGETATLSKEEKKAVFELTVKVAAGRVPVVIGIGGNNTAELVKELVYYDLNKAVAILSASPYYSKPSQEGIYQHYKALADATDKPIILYNVPGRTSSNITAETTLRLARDFTNVAGIKEASGNMVQCMHIIKGAPEDFLVTSGDDHLAMPLIACGMDGVISVAANCFPKDFCRLINLSLEGRFSEARPLQYKLLEGFDLLFAENNPAGIKAFLAEMGLIKNYLRLPLVPLSQPVQQQVARFAAQLK